MTPNGGMRLVAAVSVPPAAAAIASAKALPLAAGCQYVCSTTADACRLQRWITGRMEAV